MGFNQHFDNNLPTETHIQTQDVEGMYLSIKVDMCLEAWEKIWTENMMHIPPDTLCLFLKLVLTHNLNNLNNLRSRDGECVVSSSFEWHHEIRN